MRVFVYEYMTATATGRAPGSPDHGMYCEGRAMRGALVEDLARVPGVEPFVLPDDAAPHGDEAFRGAVARSARQIVIAPELGSELARLTALARACGDPLAPSAAALDLTSDKLALAEHWRANGVPTPATTDRVPTACEAFPYIWKPRDGAGSTDTFLVRDRFEFATARAAVTAGRPMILQEFAPGFAASVAFLCGPRQRVALPPASQALSADGRFKYAGGDVPIAPALAARATALAARAVACVPGLRGYVGVDLVLGDAADGSRDVAIEINPRLTTSYLGLRALATSNLAELMLRVASGDPARTPTWTPGRIRFAPTGVTELQ